MSYARYGAVPLRDGAWRRVALSTPELVSGRQVEEGAQGAVLRTAGIQVQRANYTGPLPRCARHPPHYLHSEAAQVERERHVL